MSSGGFPLSRDAGRAQDRVSDEHVDTQRGLDREREFERQPDPVSSRHADDMPRSKGQRVDLAHDRVLGRLRVGGAEEGFQEASYTSRGGGGGRVADVDDTGSPELPSSVRRPGRNGLGPLSPEVRHLAYRINATQNQAARDRQELRRAAQTIDMMVDSFQDARQRGNPPLPSASAPAAEAISSRPRPSAPQVDGQSGVPAINGKRILFHLIAGCTMLLLSGIIVGTRTRRGTKRTVDEMQASDIQHVALPQLPDHGAGIIPLFDYNVHEARH